MDNKLSNLPNYLENYKIVKLFICLLILKKSFDDLLFLKKK